MRLFSALFQIAKLPLVVAKDAICAIPDATILKEPFESTKAQCERIDRELGK